MAERGRRASGRGRRARAKSLLRSAMRAPQQCKQTPWRLRDTSPLPPFRVPFVLARIAEPRAGTAQVSVGPYSKKPHLKYIYRQIKVNSPLNVRCREAKIAITQCNSSHCYMTFKRKNRIHPSQALTFGLKYGIMRERSTKTASLRDVRVV